MPWVALDDSFFDHPKARAVGKNGRALFLAALCHAGSHLTDGFIAKTDLPLLVAKAEVPTSTVKALVDNTLWHVVDGGWEINDFTIYNPTAAKVRAQREREREKKRRQRAAGSAAVDHDGDGRFVSRRLSPGDTAGDRPGESSATHPLPIDVETLHPPTSVGRQRSEEELDWQQEQQLSPGEKLGRCWQLLAEFDLQSAITRGGQPRQSAPWLASAAANRQAEHDQRARELLAEHPTWTCFDLAEALSGGQIGPPDHGLARAAQRADQTAERSAALDDARAQAVPRPAHLRTPA